MGRLLLAVEQAQIELTRPAERAAPAVLLTPEEREAALRWLREPDLIAACARLFTRRASSARKPARWLRIWPESRASWKPLAVIIQSASAAGKAP